MDNKEDTYCRFCASLKTRSKLTDLQSNTLAYAEIVVKLRRINCQLDFEENVLPRTICLLCSNALQRAYSFVLAVEQAQIELKKILPLQSIKKEVENSDSENFDDKAPDEKFDDNIDIKCEIDVEDTILEPITLKNEVNSSTKKDESDALDGIPLSQLNLTWNDYNWMCSYCETQFPNISELITHSMEYHEACNAFKCTDCKIKKLSLDKYLTHIRRHRRYLQMSCYKCFVVFASTYEGMKHRSYHESSKFKCAGCNGCFLNIDDLNKHTKKYYKNPRSRNIPTQAQNDTLTCLECNKKFKSKMSLNTHLLIHTDRKRDHTCEICGKCFLHKQNLADHLLGHDDHRPFQCEICKVSFRTHTHLRRHVGVHDSVKPFSCEQCGKSFRLRRQLVSHKIVHTDSLPHVCSYCNKGFRFKTILNQHIRQHTGFKPYNCNICHWDFTNWPNYNKHMKRRHSINMAKKKFTPHGTYPIDSTTGEVVYPEKMDKMLEWKKQVLKQKKPGGPKVEHEPGDFSEKDNV